MKRWCLGAVLVFLNLVSWPDLARAQVEHDVASCDEFLHPRRMVRGQEVGPKSCVMQESAARTRRRDRDPRRRILAIRRGGRGAPALRVTQSGRMIPPLQQTAYE